LAEEITSAATERSIALAAGMAESKCLLKALYPYLKKPS
jgi:hypothetical protein